MAKQSFSNHIKYYPLHHFVFYPALAIFIFFAARGYVNHPDQRDLWTILTGGLIFTGLLAFMLRQHYALGNQDRILRLELRLRYFILTGERFEILESKLRFRQMAALRFASDEELPALVQRAINENLDSATIKKSITNWQPDHMRV
jgi:hypothetical protein